MDFKKGCVCGKSYWPSQAWQHVSCVKDGTGKDEELLGERDRGEHGSGPQEAVHGGQEKKKPFDRKAYQRQYMRAYRARKSG